MLTFHTPLDLVRERLPELPVACVRPERVSIAATWFRDNFPGDVLYAVKANPSLWALDAYYAAGLRGFDVASENEIKLITSRYPDAKLVFATPSHQLPLGVTMTLQRRLELLRWAATHQANPDLKCAAARR